MHYVVQTKKRVEGFALAVEFEFVVVIIRPSKWERDFIVFPRDFVEIGSQILALDKAEAIKSIRVSVRNLR